MEETEMLCSDQLHVQGRPLPYGSTHSWGQELHVYHNHSDEFQSLLCIDTPCFIPSDEIVVEDETYDVAAVPTSNAGCDWWRSAALAATAAAVGLVASTTNALGDIAAAPAAAETPCFTFPGAYPGQQCTLRLKTATTRFALPDAVLVFVMDSDGKLLLVRRDFQNDQFSCVLLNLLSLTRQHFPDAPPQERMGAAWWQGR